MNAELEEYIKRVDPGIHEAMGEIENFEEIVGAIKSDADEIREQIGGYDETEHGHSANFSIEHIAYLFAMQNRALNQLIEEVEELRPSIRFITSVLLGNAEQETTDGV